MCVSRVWVLGISWAIARQVPLSMKFSRQECWSGLPFPSPGDLPDPGTEPESPALQADSLLSESPGKSLNTSDEFKIYEFIMMLKKKEPKGRDKLGNCDWHIHTTAAKSLQSCQTVRPHRWQPTRLPCPCDSPGKNTGVGCHFILQCMKVKSERHIHTTIYKIDN